MGVLDLLRPRWRHSDPEIRIETIETLKDQGILARIAERDSNAEVRLSAVWRLEDEGLLARVARQTKDSAVGVSAVENLMSEDLLADIALNVKTWQVRLEATRRITSKDLLNQLADTEHLPDGLRQVARRAAERPTAPGGPSQPARSARRVRTPKREQSQEIYGDDVGIAKQILRGSLSARGFVRRATESGFLLVGEGAMGLEMRGENSRLIFTVLASRGPDRIWTFSIKQGSEPTVSLVDEGRLLF